MDANSDKWLLHIIVYSVLQINASGSSGDYHRILAPGGSYEGECFSVLLSPLFHVILEMH